MRQLLGSKPTVEHYKFRQILKTKNIFLTELYNFKVIFSNHQQIFFQHRTEIFEIIKQQYRIKMSIFYVI